MSGDDEPFCRDCADENGTCPWDGLPCDRDATPTPPSSEPPRERERERKFTDEPTEHLLARLDEVAEGLERRRDHATDSLNAWEYGRDALALREVMRRLRAAESRLAAASLPPSAGSGEERAR